VRLIKDFLRGAGEALTLDAFRRSMQYRAVARNDVAAPANHTHTPIAA
jgi:hypothetical protein